MFFEQYSHEPYVATPRFILKYLPPDSPRRAELRKRLEQGRAALKVMETQLQSRQFLVGVRRNRKLTQAGRKTELKSDPPGSGYPTGDYLGFPSFSGRVAAQPHHVPITYRPH
jgi:glutathione S-transferase